MGLVGKFNSSKPRDILVDPDVALEELDRLETSLSAAGRSAQVDHDSDVEWVDEEEYDSVTNEQD
jgi:hypothetical protein